MKNRIYTLMALAVAVTCAYGQNMAIYKAQAKIDENKLKEAEEIITPALTNPKTTKLAEMYNLAGSIQIRFLQPELIKAAQQQPCDTALFVSSLEKAVQYYTKSNEYDMQPDKKGNVKPKFHEDNHKRLMAMLPYYNYAGIMLYNNGKKDEAADMFQKFISMYQNPVFSKTEQDSIYKANKKGGVFLIDELDNSLNRNISDFIIKLYSTKIKESTSQIIFTTNNADILSGLRRDQIFIIEKNNHINSVVKYLNFVDRKTNKKSRKDWSFTKAYNDNVINNFPTKQSIKELTEYIKNIF